MASLNGEDAVLSRFAAELIPVDAIARKHAVVFGLSFGLAQLVIYFVYGGAFWFAGWALREGHIEDADDVFKSFFGIVMSLMGVGSATQFFPDAAKAKAATSAIFSQLDMEVRLDPESQEGDMVDVDGLSVALKDIEFVYPSRPNTTVLHKFKLMCPSKHQVALVGPSGSGKSSVVMLLARFYEPKEGKILLGNHDITKINLRHLRSQIGLVAQEPVLFSGSIRENIRYGKPSASDEEVEAAARNANVLEFTTDMDDGLDTDVGTRGSKLSGGQRQRVAIARALLIEPKLLLLDEATSALDKKSEGIVQAALDKLMVGRTSLVIAHRLSTIKDANKICVVEKGHIVDEGTHGQLMAKKGSYYHLAGSSTADVKETKHAN